MAFALTIKDSARREELLTKLREKADILNAKIAEFNDALAEPRAAVEDAQEDYNEVLAEARSFAEDIAREASDAIGEKSEKWKGGERGQAASAWEDEWGSVELEDIDLSFPEQMDEANLGHADNLEALSSEMEDV
jgi:cell division septum initiation protein DivIVA